MPKLRRMSHDLLLPALVAICLGPAAQADELYMVIGQKLFRADLGNVDMVEVGELDIQVSDITFTPDGELWALTTLAAIYQVDLETAETTLLMPERATNPFPSYSLHVLPDYTIYIIEVMSAIRRIDAVTGAESLFMTHPVIDEGQSLYLDAIAAVDGRLEGLGTLSAPTRMPHRLHIGAEAGSVVPTTAWDWPDHRFPMAMDYDSNGDYWVQWGSGGVIGIPGFIPVDLSAFDPATGLETGSSVYETNGPAPFAIRRLSTPSACEPSDAVLCFQNGRFRVTGIWRDIDGNEGLAQRAPGTTDQAGLLWFFSPDNWELSLKILDGCGLNGRFWFFLSGTTDVEFAVTVTDTQTGAERTYSNSLGQNAEPVVDLEAFEGCADGSP